MRDDLHRTTAVSRPLRRVLRYAAREADRATRLPRAIEEAVRVTIAKQIRSPWLESVKKKLSESADDLFRETRVRDVVRECGASAITPLEREVAECMRARAAFQQASPDLLVRAMREIAKRVGERSCEQLSAIVGKKDGFHLRKILAAARPLCQPQDLIDSSGTVVKLTRLPREDIDLDEPIAP